jgi:tetrahydromethanopterin S-methyltransferase subunit B
MEIDCVQIEKNPSLIRDISTGAVINTNKDEQARVFALRAKKLHEAQELNKLKTDVQEMKQTMDKILSILEKTQ